MKRTILISILSLYCLNAAAISPEERGLEIAIEADKRDIGFNNFVVDVQMELRNKQGDKSVREMQIKTLEVTDDGDKSLVAFNHPRDVKGTKFLSFSHIATADDQWLFLPALKRVKRISSKNKSGPFMGSEFAYEDLASQEVDKYTYKYVKDDVLDTMAAYVVEQYPTYDHSGYTKLVAWIDKQEYRVQKVEFYDRKGALLKTLTNTGYEQYLDQFWRPATMEMTNHQNGKSTTLTWADYQFQVGLDENAFNKNALKRAR